MTDSSLMRTKTLFFITFINIFYIFITKTGTPQDVPVFNFCYFFYCMKGPRVQAALQIFSRFSRSFPEAVETPTASGKERGKVQKYDS